MLTQREVNSIIEPVNVVLKAMNERIEALEAALEKEVIHDEPKVRQKRQTKQVEETT